MKEAFTWKSSHNQVQSSFNHLRFLKLGDPFINVKGSLIIQDLDGSMSMTHLEANTKLETGEKAT